MGVFTYSREENTAAHELAGQVPERVKRARRAELMQTQAGISRNRNRALIGSEVEVLDRRRLPARARLRGRIAGQAPEIDGAVFLTGEAEEGDFVRARIEKALTYDLHGRAMGAIN